ncbi:MAG: helix-turn-helix domain-containing protein [Methanothermobacter sp.]|nr:helix-turn-helix domain-containing protein [Methanothermobacter sp.]MDX9692549.1 helix-turn-helix domain-containing protein [Methanothermobacter sp.]
MLGYKFRIYPSKTVEDKLLEHFDLCRWLYKRLLQELNETRTEEQKPTPNDTQKLIVKLKNEEKPEPKKVHSKVLQMVNRQLWNNIRVLSRLKRNGKKVGRLRYKGKMVQDHEL